MGVLKIERDSSIGVDEIINCYVNDVCVCKYSYMNYYKNVIPINIENNHSNFYCIVKDIKSEVVQLDFNDKETITALILFKGGIPQISLAKENALSIQITSMTDMQKRKSYGDFSYTKEVGNLFGINDRTKQWAVSKVNMWNRSFDNVSIYNYEDIVSYELIEDGATITKGGLGAAAVGALAFGGVGAIVGGITGSKKTTVQCTSLMIKITINNIHNPVVYIKLIYCRTNKESAEYIKSFRKAQEILSLLQLICNQCETERKNALAASNVSELSTPKPFSAADEIRKFKELCDDGIITEEEFHAKKKQLLGL